MSTDKFKLSLKADQNRRRRGWILRILNYFNNEKTRELNDKLISDGLEEAGHRVHIAVLHADLRYLEERGYVGLRQSEDLPIDMMVAWITAKGVDLYEGTIADAGVKFRDED